MKSVEEVAKAFTALCAAGEFERAGDEFWAKDVVSLEHMQGDMARLQGIPALKGKAKWWYDNHDIHGTKAEGPFIHGDQFAVRFWMDVTAKAGPMAGQRIQMWEIGLYTVQSGRIVEERFFMPPMG